MTQALRLIVATGLLAGLAGCAAVPGPHDSSPTGAMAHMAFDLGWEACAPTLWITGVIVPNQFGGATIQDDTGMAYGLVWGTHNAGVVDWGRRYRIGGRWFAEDITFWACGGADAVIPQ